MNGIRLSRPKTPPVSSHADMHSDHRRWRDDHAMWRDDVAMWMKELKRTTKELARCAAALQQHGEALREHIEAIDVEEKLHSEHEDAIAVFERGENGTRLLPMAKAHQKRTSIHERQRHDHESLKRYHHVLMAHASAFIKTVREAKL